MNIDASDVRAFLTNYAKALSDGKLKAIAAAWHTPSLVLSESGVIAVSRPADVEELFKAASADFKARGISGAMLQAADIATVRTRRSGRLPAARSARFARSMVSLQVSMRP